MHLDMLCHKNGRGNHIVVQEKEKAALCFSCAPVKRCRLTLMGLAKDAQGKRSAVLLQETGRLIC
jgi:hypothetical protein